MRNDAPCSLRLVVPLSMCWSVICICVSSRRLASFSLCKSSSARATLRLCRTPHYNIYKSTACATPTHPPWAAHSGPLSGLVRPSNVLNT